MNHPTRSLLSGLAGGIAGTLAMNAISSAWSYGRRRALHGGEASLLQQGGRPDVEEAKLRGKSSGDPDAVATVAIAEAFAKPMLGRPLTREERHRGGQIVHYAYGALLGAAYGLSSRKLPVMRSGRGTLFGVSTWLAGVNVALPLLNLMKPPKDHSLEQHAFSLISHAGYGAVLDAACALLDKRSVRPGSRPWHVRKNGSGSGAGENTITR